MAPIEPVIPAELAPSNHHNNPTSTRRRSQSASRSTPGAMRAQSPRRRGSTTASSSSSSSSSSPSSAPGLRASLGLAGVARRTLGIVLLLVTVFLWTLSNFLASDIFSDRTYNKPFFLVYLNTSVFALSLLPMLIRFVARRGLSGLADRAVELWREQRYGARLGRARERGNDEDAVAGQRLLVDDEDALGTADVQGKRGDDKLTVLETAWLSLEFCMLWFAANYFASACLEYTSVASVTILTSTSSVWTLVFCSAVGVEGFTVRKLVGVLASLAGVILISTVDLSGSGNDDGNRGSFPHKTRGQIALGDAMAFFSAIIYGLYVTVMKRRVGNEDRVNMPLFFGIVGLLNVLLLWPGFIVLHLTGIEPFALPPTGRIWTILIVNSLSSFISDIAWAYAMLLTTPLVVTVGLSLTIPLSLIGEMIRYAQYSTWIYWVGAGVVFVSFLFINHESRDADDENGEKEDAEGDKEDHVVVVGSEEALGPGAGPGTRPGTRGWPEGSNGEE